MLVEEHEKWYHTLDRVLVATEDTISLSLHIVGVVVQATRLLSVHGWCEAKSETIMAKRMNPQQVRCHDLLRSFVGGCWS